MQNKTSYSKMRDGSWGIRSTVALVAGQTVTVTKRDGGTKLETVAAVVWSGNGVWLASLVATRPQSSAAGRRGGRVGSGAGSAASVPGYSSYCTDREGCRCYDCAS